MKGQARGAIISPACKNLSALEVLTLQPSIRLSLSLTPPLLFPYTHFCFSSPCFPQSFFPHLSLISPSCIRSFLSATLSHSAFGFSLPPPPACLRPANPLLLSFPHSPCLSLHSLSLRSHPAFFSPIHPLNSLSLHSSWGQ